MLAINLYKPAHRLVIGESGAQLLVPVPFLDLEVDRRIVLSVLIKYSNF